MLLPFHLCEGVEESSRVHAIAVERSVQGRLQGARHVSEQDQKSWRIPPFRRFRFRVIEVPKQSTRPEDTLRVRVRSYNCRVPVD